MPIQDLWNQDSLVWHFGLFDGGPAIGSDHDVEAPQVWVRALEACKSLRDPPADNHRESVRCRNKRPRR